MQLKYFQIAMKEHEKKIKCNKKSNLQACTLQHLNKKLIISFKDDAIEQNVTTAGPHCIFTLCSINTCVTLHMHCSFVWPDKECYDH